MNRAVALYGTSSIYWTLNYGTELQKFFEPDEIMWLKEIVLKANEKSKQKSADANQSNGDVDRQNLSLLSSC